VHCVQRPYDTTLFKDAGLETFTVDEIYVVLAVFKLMEIVQKPTLTSYFSKNSVLSKPIYSCVISMDQFESICKSIHFNNNDSKDTYQGPCKLFKIYPVVSYLNTKFQNLYIIDQNTAIDKVFKIWNQVLQAM
jgi:hypothetical protein